MADSIEKHNISFNPFIHGTTFIERANRIFFIAWPDSLTKLKSSPLQKIYYEETIKLSKENPWYFAPNAALQLGYIYRDQKDFEKARKYFEMAMSYRKHEYKSSIDTKSRSALDQMKATTRV